MAIVLNHPIQVSEAQSMLGSRRQTGEEGWGNGTCLMDPVKRNATVYNEIDNVLELRGI